MLFGEGLFTIAIRGGQEYKFISPCIALYLGRRLREKDLIKHLTWTHRLCGACYLVFGVARV